jgi:hypothetical protein
MPPEATHKRRYAVWIAVPGLIAAALALILPPAFWLCAIGGALLGLTLLAQSRRTGQFFYWPWQEHDWSLTDGEASFGLVAVTLILVPLLIALGRAWVSQ